MAVARTRLGRQERRVLEARYENPGMPQAEMACHLNISHSDVRTIEYHVRRKIDGVLQALAEEEGHDFLARDLLLMHFFPQLLRDEKERKIQFQKLANAGITFTDDGRIDLSEANDNTFYTTIFRTIDGGHISGFELTNSRSRSARELGDFFNGRNVHDDLCIPPNGKFYVHKTKLNKGPLTAEDVLAAVRDPVNIRSLQDLGHLRVGSDGRWHLFLRTADFRTRWCKFNGNDLKTGKKLLSICSIPLSQAGTRKFFETVFGSDLDFIECSEEIAAGLPYQELREEGIVYEFRSEKNKEFWKLAGVIVRNGICKIFTKMEKLDRNIKFHICGRLYLAEKLLKGLGLPQNRPGFEKLCSMVFDNCTVQNRRRPNGTIILDESDFTEIVEELKKHENIEILKAAAGEQPLESPKLSMRDFGSPGLTLNILGHNFTISTLLECLKWPVRSEGIERIYAAVFNDETKI